MSFKKRVKSIDCLVLIILLKKNPLILRLKDFLLPLLTTTIYELNAMIAIC